MTDAFKEALREAYKTLQISEVYAEKVIKEIDVSTLNVDVNKFRNWFDIWSKGISPLIVKRGSYFTKVFKAELGRGMFSPDPEKQPVKEELPKQAVDADELFESEWEQWKRMIAELSINPPDDTYPAIGALVADDNDVVRAASDGAGGLLYIDGTKSEKHSRFEDADEALKEKVILALQKQEKRNKGGIYKQILTKLKRNSLNEEGKTTC